MRTLKEQLTEQVYNKEMPFLGYGDSARYVEGEYFGVVKYKSYIEPFFFTLQMLEEAFEQRKNGTNILNTIKRMELGDVEDFRIERDVDMILFKYK